LEKDAEDEEVDKEKDSTGKKKDPLFKRTLIIIISVFAVVALAFAGYTFITKYIQERQISEAQKLVQDEFEIYSAPNFSDTSLNFSKLDLEDARPGGTISLDIKYENTGQKPVKALKITVDVPGHTSLVEESLKSTDHLVKDNRLIIDIGELPINSGGDINIEFAVETPIENNTVIIFDKALLSYVKESEILKKSEVFTEEISIGQEYVVESKPDLGTSFLSADMKKEGEILDMTFGDQLTFHLFIYNSGDTYAEDVSIKLYGLSDLEIDEDTKDITSKGDHLSFEPGMIDPGKGKVYEIKATALEGVEDEQVITPYAKVYFDGREIELFGPEISVKLYPSFEGSDLTLSDINGHGVYSDDIIAANITVTNTGDTEASHIIVDLIYSNIFSLFEGTDHWEIDKLGVGESTVLESRLKIVSGITKDSYGSAGFSIKADDIEKYISQDRSILVNGSKPFTRNLIPIVGIHGIEPSPKGAYELSIEKFEYLCGTLKSMGYETITFRDLLDYLDFGKTLPEKPVIITSDDGYRSTYTYAFPVLQKYGYKMTVFLVTGLVGNGEADRRYNEFDFEYKNIPRRPLFIWPEIYQMSGYGCEFLSHTVTHRLLGGLSIEESVKELSESKQVIEQRLGKAVPFVSWPHDNYAPDHIALIQQLGYRGAVKYSGGVEDVRSINIYAIKRVPIFAYTNPGSYAALLRLE